MDDAATPSQVDSEPIDALELRAAPRVTLLIRAARLVAPNGEFVCVIRDVSETGISVRLFHALPTGRSLELHMPGGDAHEIRTVWTRDHEAGFEFAAPVDLMKFIHQSGAYPKRGLRLGVHFPISITTTSQSAEGIIENLSQQGARFECEELFAIDQSIRISGHEIFREIRAKVRWRRDNRYGVVFDDTFSLGDFARLVARLQAPQLLEG